MQLTGNTFTITLDNEELSIREYMHEGSLVYYIISPRNEDMYITKTIAADNKRKWTPVPEGNVELARKIGILIEEHFRRD